MFEILLEKWLLRKDVCRLTLSAHLLFWDQLSNFASDFMQQKRREF